jgi:hypothetical protein
MVGLKGCMMEVGEVITVARAAFQKQNMSESDVKPGDAIFLNTGWGSLWMKNNDKFNSGEPGLDLEIAKWVIEKDLCLTGGDTWGDVVPFPDKLAFACHQELQTKPGIYNHYAAFFDFQRMATVAEGQHERRGEPVAEFGIGIQPLAIVGKPGEARIVFHSPRCPADTNTDRTSMK